GRSTDPFSVASIPEVVLADLRVEYTGIGGFTVFVQCDNILNQDHRIWQGYSGSPFSATLGASYRW
ncbi:MAG: hypothetical protein WD295_05270, partial [Bacteroidota bacterium]